MIPILFDAGAVSFTTFGIGALASVISCEVEESRNGSYELEMTYPITGAFFEEIQLRRLIVAKPNYTDNPQPFRIYSISKPLNGIVTINAQHISYDLSGYIDAPFTAAGIRAALTQMVYSTTIYPTSCPFTFTTDKNNLQDMTLKHPESVRALMGGVEGSLLDVYGGEWHFDGLTCDLETARGSNRGVSIRYGKNLIDLRQEENNESVYTGVYPYYYESDSNTLVVLPEKVINVTGTFGYTKILKLDLTADFTELPTVAQLRARAEIYITNNEIGIPKVNLTVGFQELESTLARVDLCDTVTVVFDALGVSATAKCIRTKWDVLKGRYIEAEFGSKKTSLAATIADTYEIEQAIKQYSSMFGFVAEKVAKRVTGNRGGYIYLHDTDNDGEPDEILIMDSDDINTAVRIIRINNGGIAFSKTGYNGTYTTAWNIDGEFSANFIASGELQTDLVKILGNTKFYWDSDNITIIDPNDSNKIIHFGKYDGTNYGLGFTVDGGTTWKTGFNFDGIKIIGDVNNTGRAEMDGDSFDIINENGVSICHIGVGTVIDENGNTVSGVYNRLGTYSSYNGLSTHGIYSFSAGRMNSPFGPYSIAMGYQCRALGNSSVAIGKEAIAEDDHSYAIGYNAKATNGTDSVALGPGAETKNDSCVAIGISCVAGDSSIGKQSVAVGFGAEARSVSDVAIGDRAIAGSGHSVAIGYMARALGIGSNIALGRSSYAYGLYSLALGPSAYSKESESVAIGDQAQALAECAFAAGAYTKAENDYQFACGKYNSTGSNHIFTLGNGTDDNTRANAMTVDLSGNEVIAGSLTQHSDGRLKEVSGDIPDVAAIRAVRFKWNEKKHNRDDNEHIGYIAQDVEPIAPYLVHENENGIKTLDYIALLCAKVDQLERTVERMAKRIEELEGRIA